MVRKMKIEEAKKREVVESKATIRTIAIAAVVVVIIAVIAGVAIYQDRVAPFRVTVIEVDGSSITMRYFLKRILSSGREPMAMLQTLTSEEIIKQVAPKPPYDIDIREEDIEQFLKGLARGKSDTITEKEFKEWYRQRLNESRLSESEFRDLMRTNLSSQRLYGYLAERVPTIAEQVHLYMISVKNFEDAKKVKERLEAGEDFRTLAREVSSDEELKKKGGELGWFPRGALGPNIAKAAFDDLEIGGASEPLYLDEQNSVVVMVSEKVSAREIDEDSLKTIKARALEEWLNKEFQYHKVQFHGFNNGYDSETNAWVQWQLQRMRKQYQAGEQ
jgi:parvulin-like peptidyl-prolyl isomerase